MMLEHYRFKTEMHAHTSPASSCSEIPADKMAEIYKNLGYDSLCITNHFTPAKALALGKNAFIDGFMKDFNTVFENGKKLGLNVIFGVELRFCENENDYLVFGVGEGDLEVMFGYLERGIAEFYRDFSREDNLILQAHPFRDGMSRAPIGSIDGVEAFNVHPGHNSRVSVTAKYAAEHDYLVSCGTDFHHPGHEGQIALRTTEEVKNSYDLARIIKSRDYLFSTGNCLILPYANS